MENVSQVVLRNLHRLSGGETLLVNPEPDELFRELARAENRVRASTSSHAVFRELQARGADVRFEAVPVTAAGADAVILVLPREKERLDLVLSALAPGIEAQARLWLVGANRAGIKSAPRVLERHFDQVRKLDSARHCVLLEAGGAVSSRPFRLDDFSRSWPLELPQGSLEMVSLPGVFAHGRLDAGTALLLDVLADRKPGGDVLDFASGCGAVGIAVLAARPDANLTLLDDSALAIEAGKRSLAANGLTARSLPSNGLAELGGNYDWIVSNPPFHRGVSDDLGVAKRFFGAAGTFLKEKGRILVVFNRHLPYAGWMREQFNNVNCLAQNREFTVIEASKPI